MKNKAFFANILTWLDINHVVLALKLFYLHLNDKIVLQNIWICSNKTTFVIFRSYFLSHNRNLSSWSYSWIKPLASRLVDPIPVSWFSLADFGELNLYSESSERGVFAQGAACRSWPRKQTGWISLDPSSISSLCAMLHFICNNT